MDSKWNSRYYMSIIAETNLITREIWADIRSSKLFTTFLIENTINHIDSYS